MEYLLMLYSDESQKPDLQPGTPEFDAMMASWMAYNDELAATGQLVSGASLQPTMTATVVDRAADGTCTLSDGPYAETKEQIGGYYLIDVEDLDAARDAARRAPLVGRIEVRPIAFNPKS